MTDPGRPSPPPVPPPTDPAPRRRASTWVAAAAAVSLASGVLGGVVGARLADDDTTVATGGQSPVTSVAEGRTATAAGPALDVVGILAKVEPAVVAIQASGRGGTGQGTGIVITPEGEVLTNAHVVDGASNIRVTLQGESQSRAASLVGADSGNDIALLRIQNASGLRTADLGSSGDVKVGDDVVAVGNALGLRGDPTVTKGIVSGLNRSLDTLTGMIQTDAAINPGNSGGPLANNRGQVIGINTAVAGRGGQNIGFAIPIDSARTILDRLRSGQAARPVGYLGVSTRNPMDNSRGAEVVEVVPGGPAARAGLRVGDRITEVDGRQVVGSVELGGLLRDMAPGTSVPVTVARGGATERITVTLGERPRA
ncbi:MAG: trypsin-like peptidase domain-containing protein [Actinomycetota bacterium]|nr:trypsin-like peptidase domain-containing protein [Actinomycetota bacterium]